MMVRREVDFTPKGDGTNTTEPRGSVQLERYGADHFMLEVSYRALGRSADAVRVRTVLERGDALWLLTQLHTALFHPDRFGGG